MIAFFILNAHMFRMLLFSILHFTMLGENVVDQRTGQSENIVMHLFDYVFNCCLHHKM